MKGSVHPNPLGPFKTPHAAQCEDRALPFTKLTRRAYGGMLVACAVATLWPPPAARAADAQRVVAEAFAASGGAAWDRVRSLHIHAVVRQGERTGIVDELQDVWAGRFVRRVAYPGAVDASGFDGVAVWAHGRGGVS